MAIMLNDQGQRSRLQERLAAELKEKLARSGSDEGEKVISKLQNTPDMVGESQYIKDFEKKPASEISRVTIIIIACIIILAVFGLILVLV